MTTELRVRLSPTGEGLELIAPSGHALQISAENLGPIAERMLHAAEVLQAQKTIGTEASPVQSMVQKWLRGGGRIRKFTLAGAEQKLTPTLADLGLV